MERMIETVNNTIDEINQLLPVKYRLEKGPDTLIFDKSGKGGLDSLGLMNFIVALEQKVQEEYGKAVVLTDEKVIFKDDNPVMTVNSLAKIIVDLLGEGVCFEK